MYPVIVEPPVTGRFQLITTLLPLTVVTGGVGVLGLVAAIIEKGYDGKP